MNCGYIEKKNVETHFGIGFSIGHYRLWIYCIKKNILICILWKLIEGEKNLKKSKRKKYKKKNSTADVRDAIFYVFLQICNKCCCLKVNNVSHYSRLYHGDWNILITFFFIWFDLRGRREDDV